jgi:hypothetical protein
MIVRFQLKDGVSLALLLEFAQDMFPGVSTEHIGVWPADDGELVVSGARWRSTYSQLKGRRAPSTLPPRLCQKSEDDPTPRNILRIRPWRPSR